MYRKQKDASTNLYKYVQHEIVMALLGFIR